VITSLRRQNIIGDEVDDIAGLYFKAPTSAVLMFIFLLSLTGIPPLAGFYGKYFIFLSLLETGSAANPLNFYLAGLAVFYVAVSLYYYLRIANAMFMGEAVDAEPVRLAPGVGLTLAITGLATVGIGLFPDFFIRAAEWSLRSGGGAAMMGSLR
jgi:NADH-quinone oxidoreductase subunit N